MSAADRPSQRRAMRAPQADEGLLVKPPLEVVPALAAGSAQQLNHSTLDLGGRTLGELRRAARCDLVAAAMEYTRRYRDVPPVRGCETVWLAGHQPELFHPGVWAKNFALAGLASRHGGVAVHLLVDNDTLKSTSIRVPTGTVDQPRVAWIPFDQPAPEMPYEERPILDRDLLTGFAKEVGAALGDLVPDPLVHDFWPRVVALARQENNLGACLAAARHQLEGDWGLQSLEVPVSRVCRLPAFAWLAAWLLVELPQLWSVYNQAVAEYRLVNRIRSLNHPVPELVAFDQWREAPFWVWRAGDTVRGRLFVRQVGGRLQLSDRRQIALEIPGGADRVEAVAEAMTGLEDRGIKLRTRALTTTMLARLVLGDLFIHGIGGAKYDELTDAIVERFFGIEAPPFLTVSATLRLPIPRPQVGPADLRAVNHRLRELTWHPERHLDGAAGQRGEVRRWVEEKERWIQVAPHAGTARRRFEAIRRANAALQPAVAPQRQQFEAQRSALEAALRGERILSSREYAFCLYPEQKLREFLLAISSANS